MSAPALFLVGSAVTLLVLAAIALLVYAAVLDGRDERAARALASVTPLDSAPSLTDRRRPTAA